MNGIPPWKIPIVSANFKEFLSLLELKIKPCENETTKQSIPKATASNNKSIKLNFHLKQSIPRKFITQIKFFT